MPSKNILGMLQPKKQIFPKHGTLCHMGPYLHLLELQLLPPRHLRWRIPCISNNWNQMIITISIISSLTCISWCFTQENSRFVSFCIYSCQQIPLTNKVPKCSKVLLLPSTWSPNSTALALMTSKVSTSASTSNGNTPEFPSHCDIEIFWEKPCPSASIRLTCFPKAKNVLPHTLYK